MADFDVAGAQKAGYSDSEIAEYLAKQNRFNLQGARKAGYSDGEIISHLTGQKAPDKSVPGSEGAKVGEYKETPLLERVKALPETAVAAGQGTLASLAGAYTSLVSPAAGQKVEEAMSPTPSTAAQANLDTVGNAADALKVPDVWPAAGPMGGARMAGAAAQQEGSLAADAARKGVQAVKGALPEAKPILNANAITAANKAGYVIPPSQAGGGMVSRALEGFSGKIKTAQKASQANAETTNKLVRQAMNLKPDQPITSDSLQAIRQQAGQSYAAIANIPEITPTPEFKATVAELGGDFKAAAKEFPELLKNDQIDTLISQLNTPDKISGQAAIEVVKKLRADATANLKAFDKPERRALGLAQRKAAEAVDDLIQQNLENTGNKGLVEQYRKDRQAIAKSYDVESALNDSTGNVSALYLARLADKGRPLTGELKQVAKFAKAFPKAAQDVEKIGSLTELSVLDYATGGLASLATGHIGAAAAVATRPAVRAGILSKPYQSMLARRAAAQAKPEAKSAPRKPAAPAKKPEQQMPLRTLLESEQAGEQEPLKKAVGE